MSLIAIPAERLVKTCDLKRGMIVHATRSYPDGLHFISEATAKVTSKPRQHKDNPSLYYFSCDSWGGRQTAHKNTYWTLKG